MIDYIFLHLAGWQWPAVFNLADVMITFGCHDDAGASSVSRLSGDCRLLSLHSEFMLCTKEYDNTHWFGKQLPWALRYLQVLLEVDPGRT